MSENEVTEMWRDIRAARQEKRSDNRQFAVKLLTACNVTHEVKNDGAHLIVSHSGCVVDFWPGTGLWKFRKPQTLSKRGIYSLLNALQVQIP